VREYSPAIRMRERLLAIHGMNHFNVLTDKLEEVARVLTGVLGSPRSAAPLELRRRLDVTRAESRSAHLRGEAVRPTRPACRPPRVQARATSRDGKRLKAKGVELRCASGPDTHIWQIFCNDPAAPRWSSISPPTKRRPRRPEATGSIRLSSKTKEEST